MEYVKLRNYIELISGRDLTKCQYNDKNDGIPYIMGASNMTNGKLNIERWTDKPTVIGEKFDLIISVKGTVGELLILEEEKVHLSRQVMAIRPKKQYDVKFMFYYMKYYLDRLKAKAKGMIPGVTREDILDAEFIEVSSEKQQKIIKILDKAQELIDKRKEQIEALDELVKSQFIEMFGSPNEKRFGGKTLPEIIENNKYALKRGPFGGSLKKGDFIQEGYLVYEQRHAIHNDFEYAKYFISKEKYDEMIMFKVEPKDLLVSCSGVTLGRISEVPEGAKEGIINQALLKITLNQNVMNNIFFMQLFRNEQIQDKLFGFSRGSGIPNFPSMNEVKSMEFLCPPIELQNQFANFVKQVDKLKFEMQESLKELEDNFNSLMQRAFKGELFI
ncbi:restriction endonuclease subunit S [Clostridium neonatale]|uniref:Type I restriction enzyme, S subunit n=1 Tax=Clostridium neonatale TaxID=137838 RepID=A0AAD1YIX3_9CLOT|nr:restriction endonuclease subunit S [Clostridium neonatale]CAI3214356.1 type I restriction enzyme, S subunit [Clostridium neonatale]CAI3215056.1 type I restriction enzyme, S subunit [Clostridium neonatale]CAI3560467.1 type I restriction enzyme, S subunit [Clostridium neonatale]CAI3613473.1 type I restriction enzyme, S subunit [Clostridium neonatale]CAI3635262.1 type I restriction enzyme, S subunit [Clostridium neonatale]